MKEIIQSIHPKWTKLIFDGRKTKELRKSKPRDITFPFKVYIYETKKGVGAVVGEYICKGITTTNVPQVFQDGSCVHLDEIIDYMGNGKISGWDISNVKKYPKPILISKLGLTTAPQSWRYIDTQR
ncbi:hypothetical protein BHU72_14585 [Desulfuribacillus stibiiarsenatis]|uniref:Uncharacterized protein n=1 Tax=Desulfuribacillus stibiiarsenatis TaxID=1390249 RepID=A0A1E5L7R3_9FIRM|nr:ASCH domain-containing protein [Desulfuribacillus stibiiarsenatis]OEH86054.1 hypothetical protein BHU72_14585 [Desulfuribacillus stibiiarsenatis]